MDRTSSSTQNATPFTYEAMPIEIHCMILNQIPERNSQAGRPTLRSVSCVNQQLHAVAMPFLMECYVSTVEIAVPALSSEKKVEALVELKNWLTVHADQMPTIAYVDALKRTEQLTDELNLIELISFLPRSGPSFAKTIDESFSVNDMIAMQMGCFSYTSASDKLAVHYRKEAAEFEKFIQDS